MTLVRARVYESDPIITVVERLNPDDALSPYYQIPDHLVTVFETADRQFTAARKAIEDYISVHRLTEHDPSWMDA